VVPERDWVVFPDASGICVKDLKTGETITHLLADGEELVPRLDQRWVVTANTILLANLNTSYKEPAASFFGWRIVSDDADGPGQYVSFEYLSNANSMITSQLENPSSWVFGEKAHLEQGHVQQRALNDIIPMGVEPDTGKSLFALESYGRVCIVRV
jgi:hypothetical protein